MNPYDEERAAANHALSRDFLETIARAEPWMLAQEPAEWLGILREIATQLEDRDYFIRHLLEGKV